MSNYAYVALDSKGKMFRGSIAEKSWTSAIRRVKEMGLFPTSVKEESRRAIVERLKATWQPTRTREVARPRRFAFGKIPAKVLTAFTRQLATLLDAGVSLVRGLRAIEQQEENRILRNVLRKIILDVEGGSQLSEALANHPKIFDKLYINMVVAGETAGMLESTLARLADFMERSQKIRSKIKAALFYPAAVISVATALLIFLSVWVIPRFQAVFADLFGGQPLPAFTQFVMGSSYFIRSHLIHLLVLTVAVVAAYKFTKATKKGLVAIDRVKLNLPVFGRINRKAAICRFARTLGTMLENGVPILQALTIARETTSNTVFARAIMQTHDRVKEGDGLTPPLHASGLFPATVISMIDVGEQTGALPNMLLKVADTYETEVDNSISAALSLLEPALIVFLAVVVGCVVIAMFLPIIVAGGGFGGDSGAM